MIRGTTPTITYHINSNLDFENIEEAWITVEQEVKHTDIEKTWKYSENRVFLDASLRRIYVVLSQEETLAFDAGNVEVQLRILMKDGTSLATKVKVVPLDKILTEGSIAGAEESED